jgi:hypothetical protein
MGSTAREPAHFLGSRQNNRQTDRQRTKQGAAAAAAGGQTDGARAGGTRRGRTRRQGEAQDQQRSRVDVRLSRPRVGPSRGDLTHPCTREIRSHHSMLPVRVLERRMLYSDLGIRFKRESPLDSSLPVGPPRLSLTGLQWASCETNKPPGDPCNTCASVPQACPPCLPRWRHRLRCPQCDCGLRCSVS